MSTPPEHDQLIYWRKILQQRLSEGELRTLCFDLNVDYESLPGVGKADKARELMAYCERQNSVAELVRAGERLRSDISWSDNAKAANDMRSGFDFVEHKIFALKLLIPAYTVILLGSVGYRFAGTIGAIVGALIAFILIYMVIKFLTSES